MRRLLVAAAVLALVAGLSYSAAVTWLAPDEVTTTSADGRLLATATQPGFGPVPQSGSGFDVSFPQCRRTLPTSSAGFAIVGLNYGKPFSANPCFARLWQWAMQHESAAVYINMADPGKGTATDYGARIADDTLRRLAANGVPDDAPVWLDIEAANSWTSAQRAVQVINETMRQLTAAGHPVGIYAAPRHWFEITLNAVVDVPVWLPVGRYASVAAGQQAAAAACRTVAFGDRAPDVVQFITKAHGRVLDHDLRCG